MGKVRLTIGGKRIVADHLIAITLDSIPAYGCMFLGVVFLLATNPGTMMLQLAAVPKKHRPFGFAAAALLRNGLGHIPGPIAMGALADNLAPVSDDDSRDPVGLRLTILVSSALLTLAVGEYCGNLIFKTAIGLVKWFADFVLEHRLLYGKERAQTLAQKLRY